MLKAYGYIFYLTGSMVTRLEGVLGSLNNPNAIAKDNFRGSFLKQLETIKNACKGVDLSVTIKGIEWTEKQVKDGITYQQIGSLVGEIGRRVQDEMSALSFFYLPSARAAYYPQPNKPIDPKFRLLGPKATTKFSKSVEDSEEAAKCIALGRYTAAVFHMMRVLERGVQRLGKKLQVNIPVEEKDWGAIAVQIGSALKHLPITTPTEKKRHAKYARAAAYLDNVREAWRNPTMHPKETYTEEEAQDIFSFVRLFMEHLAKIV